MYSFFSIDIQATGGTPSSFTAFGLTGDLLFKPQISGIGGSVYSTVSSYTAQLQRSSAAYATLSGTSMATPYVAGYVYTCILIVISISLEY